MPPIIKFFVLLACAGFVLFIMYANRNMRSKNLNGDVGPVGSSSVGEKIIQILGPTAVLMVVAETD